MPTRPARRRRAVPGVLVDPPPARLGLGTKEITRRFAAHGYNAICPNLYARQGLDVDPDDAAAATREAGGIPDEQFVGDAAAAVEVLRALPTSNGKVGVIGYCSGGRHSFLTAVACRSTRRSTATARSSPAPSRTASRSRSRRSSTGPRSSCARCSASSGTMTSSRAPSRWTSSRRR